MILPEQNGKDLSELPDEVRGEMEFILSSRIEDVLAAAIPGLADRLAGATQVTVLGQAAEDGNGRIAAAGGDAAGESKNR